MKNLFVLLFALVAGINQIIAADNNPLELDRQLRDEVAHLLKDPEINVEKNHLTAKIQFTVNKNGEIVVLNVDSRKEFVIDYVKSRLNYKKVVEQNVISANRIFNLALIIKKPQNI